MEHSSQMAKRFREVFLNGRWIANTNYKEQLSDLNWEQATKRVGSSNTIAALTYHVNYYIAGILNVLEGGTLEIRDKYSFDLPEIKSKADWDKLLNELLEHAERFANQVALMPAETLEAQFVEEKYGTYRRNIEGMIEHGYYHLGQIALLKKLILAMEKKEKSNTK